MGPGGGWGDEKQQLALKASAAFKCTWRMGCCCDPGSAFNASVTPPLVCMCASRRLCKEFSLHVECLCWVTAQSQAALEFRQCDSFDNGLLPHFAGQNVAAFCLVSALDACLGMDQGAVHAQCRGAPCMLTVAL